MNCAEFEKELATLLAAPDAERREAPALGRLREHAAGCAACARCTDMLEWLEMPASERDAVDDPGAEYWHRFDERLRRRVEREESSQTFGRRHAWLGVAAAVLVAIAFLVPWLTRDGDEPEPARPAVAEGSVTSDLDEILGGADPETALREVEIVVGVADIWSLPGGEAGIGAGGALIPSVGEIELQDRRQLIEWLESETERLEGGSA